MISTEEGAVSSLVQILHVHEFSLSVLDSLLGRLARTPGPRTVSQAVYQHIKGCETSAFGTLRMTDAPKCL